jgi:transposase InsO family protein
VRLAGLLPHPPSTIGKVLRRHGCSRLPRPEGVSARCARRYERERPGELLHVDTKKLGRFWEPGKRVLGERAGRPQRNRRIGWQHLHVAIDDHSRLAYAELVPGQDAEACVRFLERAVAWYEERGILVERVLTDNAKAYHSRAWVEAAHRLEIERRYTRIYRPRTNGKAELFIQTLLAEWAYARSYPSSSARARTLSGYLRWYNRRRPHSSLGARPPISRVSHLCGSRHLALMAKPLAVQQFDGAVERPQLVTAASRNVQRVNGLGPVSAQGDRIGGVLDQPKLDRVGDGPSSRGSLGARLVRRLHPQVLRHERRRLLLKRVPLAGDFEDDIHSAEPIFALEGVP